MSSIEWLFYKLWETPKDKLNWHSILKQAKAMHKEEIVKSNEAGFDDGIGFIEEIKYKNAEDYYIKTFGGDNERD